MVPSRPGIAISMDALFHHAAALRRVELVEPRSVIGKSTVESIQSGALYGYAEQVDGMCRRIMDELGHGTVVATGGLSEHRGAAVAAGSSTANRGSRCTGCAWSTNATSRTDRPSVGP